METEEEWNKDFSAQKILDKKVLCKQNGSLGKIKSIGISRVYQKKTIVFSSFFLSGYALWCMFVF